MTDSKPAAEVIREVIDDVRELKVHAIDSPAYRHGAHDALAAAIELLERRAKDVALGQSCRFPGCHRCASPETGMCERHAVVRVASSYLDDRHTDGGHG